MRSVSPGVPDRPATVAARTSRALLSLAIVAMFVVSGMLPAAAKDRPPGGVLTNPVVRAIDLASPAVVRIATLYNAHITLSACGVTASLPASGAYTVGGLGSGAFVSAHGDILTADHVVDIDRESLDATIFNGRQASADVAAFLNVACHPSVPVTPNDVANGIVQFNGIPFSTSYSPPRVLVWRSTSYLGSIAPTSTGSATSLLSGLMKAAYHEAKVVKTSSFDENDLAVLHVDLTDTPSIQLGPSNQLAVEDTLAVIGFPGNGDFSVDPTNLLTPSINNVNVSALKRNGNGSQLIQVGGNVEHGDSGGPALDANGRIVGVVSFGGIDSQGITAFLRSSDSALELLNTAHIDTTPGPFQTLWQQAFAAYSDTTPGHWGNAAHQLDALGAHYPEFRGADAYRAYADNAAVGESSSLPAITVAGMTLPLPIVVAVGGGVALLLVLLIVVISVRRGARRRAKQREALQLQAAWPSSGLPETYPGSAASPYSQMTYNAPAQPTRPAAQQPPAYSQANPPTYAPPYSGYLPQGGASTNGASNQPRPNSGPASAGTAAYSGRSGAQSELWQDGAAIVQCANGHPMQAGAARCPVCGAERAQPTSSAPREVNAPPWAQNW